MKSRDSYTAELDEKACCGLCNEPIEPYSPTIDVCEGTLNSRGYVAFPDAVTSYHRLCYQSRVGDYERSNKINGGSGHYSGRQKRVKG